MPKIWRKIILKLKLYYTGKIICQKYGVKVLILLGETENIL